jgi:hypothetical protein
VGGADVASLRRGHRRRREILERVRAGWPSGSQQD